MSRMTDTTKGNNRFDYLLKKINQAEFETEPFKHLEIKKFLKEEHFDHITQLDTIATSGENDRSLVNHIKKNGYNHVNFPGTFDSVEEYISHRQGEPEESVEGVFDTIEDKGIVFRLAKNNDPVLNDLSDLFQSKKFVKCISNKFGLSPDEFDIDVNKGERKMSGLDTGLQKYLDGYEISPHPDIRRKALTWMLNLNPSSESEELNHHTHYMKLKDEKKYIKEFWKHNTEYDRCWVPWEWCETVKRQVENNSIVFFSPNYDTIHGVKTDYNHLETQRTQFYGNLWYENVETLPAPEWDNFVIKPKSEQNLINRGVLKKKKKQLGDKKDIFKKAVQNPSDAVRHLTK